MEDNVRWKMTLDGNRSLMDEHFWWKTSFDGIQPLMGDDLSWKMEEIFGRRWPLMESKLWWKTGFVWEQNLIENNTKEHILWWTIFDRRQLLVQYNLGRKTIFYLWWKKTGDGRSRWWKMTFKMRQHLMEDKLWWKTSIYGRWPSLEDNFWWNTAFDGWKPSIHYPSSIFHY